MLFHDWINNCKQRDTFKFEIAIVLLLKVIFLVLLWYLCFHDPLGDHLNDQQMVSHIITSSSSKNMLTKPTI